MSLNKLICVKKQTVKYEYEKVIILVNCRNNYYCDDVNRFDRRLKNVFGCRLEPIMWKLKNTINI